MERHELLEDAQEAFRKGRSTQRQLKLQSFLEDQRNAKHPVVLLYLDIKNAFTAMNHRALFRIMELCGYPAADVALFQHMYKGAFLFLGNPFGDSAACYLARGAPQGVRCSQHSDLQPSIQSSPCNCPPVWAWRCNIRPDPCWL